MGNEVNFSNIQPNKNQNTQSNVQIFDSAFKLSLKSIFTLADTDKNGTLTKQEAQAFGFTYDGDDLTLDNFERTVNDNKLNIPQVHQITLSDEQKKVLQQRIQAFDEYYNGLNAEQKAFVDRSKKEMVDFFPEYNKDNYPAFMAKFNQIKTAFKDGKKLPPITNEELSWILHHTDTSDIKSDGKIGSFAQGRVGDCWFLSMLNNYASNPEGAENLKNRLKSDGNGNYAINFDNPITGEKEEIPVSKEELEQKAFGWDKSKYFSSGDIDVAIYEIATNKLLNKYLPDYEKWSRDEKGTPEKDENGKNKIPYDVISESSEFKRLLVHRALGYEPKLTTYIKPSDSNYGLGENSNIIEQITWSLKVKDGKLSLSEERQPTEYSNFNELLKGLNLKANELTAGTGQNDFKGTAKDQRYITRGHAYNLMSFGENFVVNDPYNSAFPHTISPKIFDDYFNKLAHFPMTPIKK